MEQVKNYIVIIRDHSVSMSGLRGKAREDYNSLISGVKKDAIAYGFDTIVSVVECASGAWADVKTIVENSSINALSPLKNYVTEGRSTPLFDSVKQAIEICKRTPDFNDPKVAFLVTAITDGEENSSHIRAAELANEIKRLQATDRWTFTFRVPTGGYKRQLLTNLRIPEGNIAEWEVSERGLEASTQIHTNSFSGYYADLKRGETSTKRFFTDLSEVSVADVKKTLVDISDEVSLYRVNRTEVGGLANAKDQVPIREFIEETTDKPYVRGSVFYELMKTEKVVQGDKLIAIKHRKSGKVYSGSEARSLIGLSDYNSSVSPGDHTGYYVFIQSKSVNRYLPFGVQVLHWPKFREL